MESDDCAVLGDHVSLQRGSTYESRLLGRPGPKLLGLASINRNGGFRRDSLKTYGGASPERLLVRPGELYVSLKDVTQSADLLGAVARLPQDESVGRLTQDTVRLEPKSNDVPLDYIYWLLRTPQYRRYCRAHATGTTNLGLPRDDFLAFPVPKVNATRSRLVDVLEALEDKIELNRRMSETYGLMARAIFKSWFVDFEPVRAKVDGRDTGLSQKLIDLFPVEFQDSQLGLIPKGWKVRALGELADVKRGLSYKGSGLIDDGGLPMVNLGCFGGDGSFRSDKLKRYGGSYKERHLVEPGDLVVANTDMTQKRVVLGSPVLVPKLNGERQFLYSHHGYAVRFREGYGAWRHFVYYSLLRPEFREVAEGFATGTTVLALPKDGLLNYSMVIPPGDVRAAFDQAIEPMVARMNLAERQSQTLGSLRDVLLPRLVSGELCVGGAEQIDGERV